MAAGSAVKATPCFACILNVCVCSLSRFAKRSFAIDSIKFALVLRGAIRGGGFAAADARRGSTKAACPESVSARALNSVCASCTPIQEISEDRRPYSIFGQRFMTTLMPAASALAAAASSRAPSCIQITFGNGVIFRASSTIGMMWLEFLKMSIMSTGRPISSSEATNGLAKQGFADVTGIDRDHVIAALGKIFESEITGSHVDRRSPDHSDRLHAIEDFADIIVGVGVVVHLVSDCYRAWVRLSGPATSARASR